MVQGAAAEFFKVWAVTVRARSVELPARIVLCLHDELLLHVRDDAVEHVVRLLDECLAEAAHRWFRDSGVRFVADTSVVKSWADAK
jgi:DNA polymerase-1